MQYKDTVISWASEKGTSAIQSMKEPAQKAFTAGMQKAGEVAAKSVSADSKAK